MDQKQNNMNVIVNQEQKVINAEHIQINKDVSYKHGSSAKSLAWMNTIDAQIIIAVLLIQ